MWPSLCGCGESWVRDTVLGGEGGAWASIPLPPAPHLQATTETPPAPHPSGEYQVSLHQGGSSGIPRHRDALPDGGRKHGRRRLSCMVCCGNVSSGADAGVESDSGAVSIWPPRRMPQGGASERGLRSEGGGVRRSLAGSDAGTSYTESDTCSLRSHYIGGGGAGLGIAGGSVSSSMWAEATGSVWADAAGGGGGGGGGGTDNAPGEAFLRDNDGAASVDVDSYSINNESVDGYPYIAAGASGRPSVYEGMSSSTLLQAGGTGGSGGGSGRLSFSPQMVSAAAVPPSSAAALAAAEARSQAWAATLGLPGAGSSSGRLETSSSGLSIEASAAAAAGGGGGSRAVGGSAGTAAVQAVQVKGLEWVEADGEMVLQVAPLPGRLLLFLSGAVDHAHQPVGEGAPDLVAVTAWFS